MYANYLLRTYRKVLDRRWGALLSTEIGEFLCEFIVKCFGSAAYLYQQDVASDSDEEHSGKWRNKFRENVRIYSSFMQRRKFPIWIMPFGKKIHFVSEHSLWIFMFANFQFKILSKKLILKYATRRLHVIYRRYVKQILLTRAVRIRSETNFPLWINWPIENIIMSQSERNE